MKDNKTKQMQVKTEFKYLEYFKSYRVEIMGQIWVVLTTIESYLITINSRIPTKSSQNVLTGSYLTRERVFLKQSSMKRVTLQSTHIKYVDLFECFFFFLGGVKLRWKTSARSL